MSKMIVYPLGNADSILLRLPKKKLVLFDYAAMRNPEEDDDKRCDLSTELWNELDLLEKDEFDAFAVTHLDDDHTHGAEDFFYLWHAKAFQGDKRAKIAELWVPADVITESFTKLEEGARVLQAEARHRLKDKKSGIRVFSRPDRLKDWLAKNDVKFDDVKHLITDAGTVTPGFSLATDGAEFFVHSPFAWRANESTVEDRNGNALVMQATIQVSNTQSFVLLGSDVDHTALTEIVKTTKRKKRENRLLWDVCKLPHHCSYLTLGEERGEDKTVPVEDVEWLFEKQGRDGAVIVSTSKPIPIAGTEEDKDKQPPHRQAKNYYVEDVTEPKKGDFLVTMEHPSEEAPRPIEIEFGSNGAKLTKRQATAAAYLSSGPSLRAG